MVFLLKDYDTPEGEHYTLIQTYTSCCHERILFKRTPEGYLNIETNEISEGWNKQIAFAIENQKWFPKHLQ